MSEQAAPDAHANRLRAATDVERHGEIEHDVVIVARIERDAILGARGNHASHDFERCVAVEWRDLDRYHVLDGGEALPERHRQRDAADRTLQVEADKRNLGGDGGAMLDQLVDRCTLHRRERQHAGVVAERLRKLRFALRLGGLAGEAGDHHDFAPSCLLHGDAQHRLVEPDIANSELRGVHADGESAAASIEVVARERPLPPLVELPAGVQRKGMSGYYGTATKEVEHVNQTVTRW